MILIHFSATILFFYSHSFNCYYSYSLFSWNSRAQPYLVCILHPSWMFSSKWLAIYQHTIYCNGFQTLKIMIHTKERIYIIIQYTYIYEKQKVL